MDRRPGRSSYFWTGPNAGAGNHWARLWSGGKAALLQLLLLLALVLCFVSCDSCNDGVPDCREAIDVYFSEGAPCLILPDNTCLSPPELALEYCLDTQEEAEAAGCRQEHERFRSCIEPDNSCWREQQVVLACIDGEPFEYECADDVDNDGDGGSDCADSDCFHTDGCVLRGYRVPQGMEYALDLLIVLDTAPDATPIRETLRVDLDSLLSGLRSGERGMPDLHLGIASADLGTGGYDVPGCPQPGGDGGRLLSGGCGDLGGVAYLVDSAPRGCTIEASGGQCTHDCTIDHCSHEPTTMLVDDEQGCPRCRNLPVEQLLEATSCLVDQSTEGCVFRQPLEAMRQALDEHPDNVGFLRDSAMLSVVLVTNSNDCSAADDRLFDPTQTTVDSELGPLTPFRCFEFGVSCGVDDRTVGGDWWPCEISTEPDGLLHPVSEYVAFLDALKPRWQITLSSVAGTVPLWPYEADCTVGHDASGIPYLESLCDEASVAQAVRDFRIEALVKDFNPYSEDSWSLFPICWGTSFPGLAEELGERFREPCPILFGGEISLSGCTDAGAAFGFPGDDQACNDTCRPNCTVREAYYNETPEEYRLDVPACLEVCPDGLCPGNDDSALAFAAGYPAWRDPSLPVPACWYVAYNLWCDESGYAEVRVARRQDPPPRTIAYISCASAFREEFFCHDGKDDDEDCLTDCEDSDCSASPDCIP